MHTKTKTITETIGDTKTTDQHQQNYRVRKDSSLIYRGVKPSNKICLLTATRRYFFCRSSVLFLSCVCHAFASVDCCLVVTCWERAALLALV